MDQMQHASEESNPLDRLPKIEQPKLTPIGQIDEDDAESEMEDQVEDIN